MGAQTAVGCGRSWKGPGSTQRHAKGATFPPWAAWTHGERLRETKPLAVPGPESADLDQDRPEDDPVVQTLQLQSGSPPDQPWTPAARTATGSFPPTAVASNPPRPHTAPSCRKEPPSQQRNGEPKAALCGGGGSHGAPPWHFHMGWGSGRGRESVFHT